MVWDTTSCAGGRDLPPGAYDVMLFGLQKCLGAGGGTCCMALSPRAVERAQKPTRRVPFLLDLQNALCYTDKFQTLNTPSTINIWMANQACQWMLHHGGIRAMDQLCRQHADYLISWAQHSPYFKPLLYYAHTGHYPPAANGGTNCPCAVRNRHAQLSRRA